MALSTDYTNREMASNPAESGKRVIFIPVDKSVHSQRAFNWYMAQLHHVNDNVWFVHVVRPMCATAGAGIPIELPKCAEFEVTKGKALCQTFVTKARESNVDAHAIVHVNQNAGHTIVDLIDKYHASLIVMGNRGLGTLQRAFLGSTSDYVLHHSHIPMILVPP